MDNCIFCKIVKKEIASEIIYEDDELIAFNDISPQAPVHILLVSKKHVRNMTSIGEDDKNLVCRMVLAAKEIAQKHDISDTGYRFVINCNKDGGQEVFHLHAHLIGGRPLGKMC